MNAAMGKHHAIESLTAGMREISKTMRDHSDPSNGDKIDELISMIEDGKLNIAVCGHFSAGKSSLINLLCGHSLLPSSPIPTSANMVLIRNGSPSVTVQYKNGNGSNRNKSIPLDQLDAICADGGEVKSVQISYPVDWLGDELVLLDTPGIDSTDEAHLQSTESALHLADIILYVMDYNHVQSEINFAFCKQLLNWGKPVYFIVNQVDKHREQELSFDAYREQVIQSFGDWGLDSAGFLFVSVRYPKHPLNEWFKLQWLLRELKRNTRPFKMASVLRSCRKLIQSHVQFISAMQQERIEELVQQAGDGTSAELALMVRQWQDEQQRLTEQSGLFLNELKREIDTVIENANIIPAATRDLAGEYLGSRKPGFKVGLLFTGSRTVEEKKRRLRVFHEHFAEQIHTHLEKHLRDLFRDVVRDNGLDAEHWHSVPARLNLAPEAGWLEQKVQQGTVYTDEYTMVYCKLCSAEIKAMYRRVAIQIATEMADELNRGAEKQLAALQIQLQELEERRAAFDALDEIRKTEIEYEQQLLRALPSIPDMEGVEWPVPDAALPDPAVPSPSLQAQVADHAEEPSGAETKPLSSALHSPSPLSSDEAQPLTDTANKLTQVSAILADLPGFQSTVNSMMEKAKRLRENRFTIALFGAFSAGKSSFANALIGEAVLPVSPNPTTAAINRIMPSEPGRPHRSAIVKFKTAESISEDIRFSLLALGMSGSKSDSGPERLLGRIRSIEPQHVSPKGKPHLAFLKAVEQGWSAIHHQLGRQIQVPYDQFVEYSTHEAKSCFVEWIEFYYDCPLTAHGMVLVDTPGADSINSRHTGVAFNYIKNADAVLFVTYYNHAFSQADREFLRQLGRVKDSFALDKMFFIVNAVDLASSAADVQQVMTHVEQHLLPFGIRQPRIYPISSLKALREKQGFIVEEKSARSGIDEFEQDFIRFCYRELAAMTIRAAEQDILHSIEGLVSLTEEARKGEEERKQEILHIQASSRSTLAWLQDVRMEDDADLLRHEMDELIYYVRQRLSFRYGEFYNLAFHPSSLREGQGDLKMALRAARHELIQRIAYDLSQEMLATTLRIEKFIHHRADEWTERLSEAIAGKFPGFRFEPYRERPIGTPKLEDRLEDGRIDEKIILSHFKNAKSFFEEGGKQRLKDALEQPILQVVAFYTSQCSQALQSYYTEHLLACLGEVREGQRCALEEQTVGRVAALDMAWSPEELQRKTDELRQLL